MRVRGGEQPGYPQRLQSVQMDIRSTRGGCWCLAGLCSGLKALFSSFTSETRGQQLKLFAKYFLKGKYLKHNGDGALVRSTDVSGATRAERGDPAGAGCSARHVRGSGAPLAFLTVYFGEEICT